MSNRVKRNRNEFARDKIKSSCGQEPVIANRDDIVAKEYSLV